MAHGHDLVEPTGLAAGDAAVSGRPDAVVLRNDRRRAERLDMGEITSDSGELDFDKLYQLAREKSRVGRSALAATLGDLFLGGEKILSERERALMSEILRQLIRDVEMKVRRELSEGFASRNDAPHDLIVALANDEYEVAHPVLLNSEVLQDMELVEIVRHRTQQHQLAIAMRKSLSEAVTDALVEAGDEDVVRTLLENSNAQISQTTMEYLVEQSERLDSYQNPLLGRSDLPPDLAKRMYWWVSAALREHIVTHFAIDATELDEHLERTADELLHHDEPVSDKSIKLARQLNQRGEIDAQILLKTLRQGEISLFEAMLSEVTKVRVNLIRRVIYEPGGEALAICARALDVDKPTFASIFLLSRQGRTGDRVVDPKELSRVLGLFDRITPENGRKMLRNWQRDPGYLDAVRRVQQRQADRKAG
ncbi:MAG: DUF2336 domain-containing protein [Alphaproteobacteria bacterium]